MRFRVHTAASRNQSLKSYPTAVLRRNNWDDYHYKTTFSVSLHIERGRVLELESLKICQRDQVVGYTDIPKHGFTSLNNNYCSLGQSYSYYEALADAGEDVYIPFLLGLRDMVYLTEVREAFIDDPAVQQSLLRFDTAVRALEDAPQLFGAPADVTQSRSLCFGYEGPSPQWPKGVTTEFRFGDAPELPTRLTVIIGYNGAGKTRLLANLAMLAYADRQEAEDPKFIKEHGRYLRESPQFGAIMAISYSAFDDFKIPGEGSSVNAKLERQQIKSGRTSARNYMYCGLRQVDSTGKASTSLKSIDQLTNDFHRARKRALEKDRLESLRSAMAPLYLEPSLQVAAELPDIEANHATWRKSFSRLSTGHKIVLNIVVQLCAYLEPRSMVLVDEPELHLHPPLLAALLKSIGIALEEYDSFGIAATHSPVVLQEVPARNVKVLRRYADRVVIDRPAIETFGESIGLLTQHAFNLDSKDTDYRGVIETLAERCTVEEIDELFDGNMSSQARSLVISMLHGTDAKT